MCTFEYNVQCTLFLHQLLYVMKLIHALLEVFSISNVIKKCLFQICSIFDDNNNKNKKLDKEMRNSVPKETFFMKDNINSTITSLMTNINEYR